MVCTFILTCVGATGTGCTWKWSRGRSENTTLTTILFVLRQAGAANGDVIDQMSYHSLLARAGPTSLGPGHPTESQPGFAIAAINATAGYISPVAQLQTMLAGFFSAPGATVRAVAVGAQTLRVTLAAAGFGAAAVPCVQAVAVCQQAQNRILAINRCPRAVLFDPAADPACGPRSWSAATAYNASLAPPGHAWAQLVGPNPSKPWTPIKIPAPAGAGQPVALPPTAFVVIEL